MIELDFGWARKPMREQLAKHDFPPPLVDALDRDADAIIRLHVRGLIGDRDRDRAIERAKKRFVEALMRAGWVQK